jgi:Xaa-Pro aminopeptidase
VRDSKIGVDARMISHENAIFINSKIKSLKSKLIFPLQNLVDCIWAERPGNSLATVYIQTMEFAGFAPFLFSNI